MFRNRHRLTSTTSSVYNIIVVSINIYESRYRKKTLYRKNIVGSLFFVFLASIFFIFPSQKVFAATSPGLGDADSFAILSAEAITDVGTSIITGNVGLYPAAGSFIEDDLTCNEVSGSIYDRDGTYAGADTSCFMTDAAFLLSAKNDLSDAYDALSTGDNATCTTTYAGVQDLVGLSLVPGVYCADEFTLSGTLTLSGSGVWIFRSAATLITSGEANIVGGDACDIWWKVASSATLGTNTSLKGNILALTSITMASGASLTGQAFASNGAITLDSNTVERVDCTANDDTDDNDDNTFSEDERCVATTPLTPQWASRYEVVGGVNLIWSAVGGDKVDIEITNAKGEYEYKYSRVSNNGHMFLPNVSLSQGIRIRVFNECEEGEWLIVTGLGGPGLPDTGFAPRKVNIFAEFIDYLFKR